MNPLKGACIIGQSGGPTAVINASALGAIQSALQSEQVTRVLGAANGIEGVLKERLFDMAREDPGELELLKYTPASALGSCRYKMAAPSVDDTDYRRLLEIFRKYDVRYFFYNGGNDSMDTCNKISKFMQQSGYECRVIGIPKTIDNDLVHTDHTPGYGSAAKYVASTVREITLDASVYEKKSVTIIEIMGRHAGWLTAASALARKYKGDNPFFIYLPESAFDTEKFLKDVESAFEKNCNVVVCVSEGIHDADGTFICEYDSSVGTDTFGHKMLAGCGKYLENLVKERIGVKVRSIELNVCQRCSSEYLSATDLNESENAGIVGVQAALKGETGKMITFIRNCDLPYELSYETADVNEICNMEKAVPSDWITEDGCDVTEAFIQYARPLIQGKVVLPEENGLPLFAYRK